MGGEVMDILNLVCIVVALASIGIAILVVIISRYKAKKTMKRLYKMLDDAISNKFQENTYDESMISAIESKMKYYISHNMASEYKLSEERDKIKGLISDISHQTKTPIANILLYSSLLKETGELNEGSKALLDQILSSSEKLSFLIGALIKTSRLEAGIISVKPTENSVGKLLNNIISQVEPKFREKNIKFYCNFESEKASFDMKWTTEAVYNIVDNAVKYTGDGGHINVTVKDYEMFCRIDIEDNGIGIAEEEQNKIFSRFYRSQQVQNIEGIGIGLFITRKILSAQGGYMKVASKVGTGSTFSVFLPKEIFQNC